ncbi:unnamed protein product [Colias eurytheme]|nr:unnamed protein product [Colias eurytheme]
MNLIKNATVYADARLQIREAYCGTDYEGDNKIHKVCCSDLQDDNNLLQEKLKLLPNKCGDINEDRNIPGRNPGLDEYTWMAAIFENSKPLKFLCTGTIINSKHILTSANCVINKDITVRIGEYDLRTELDCVGEQPFIDCKNNSQDISVSKIILHENFQLPLLKDNIALLYLSEDINFNYTDSIPVCLPNTPELMNKEIYHERGTILGWGNAETMLRSFVLVQDICNSEE